MAHVTCQALLGTQAPPLAVPCAHPLLRGASACSVSFRASARVGLEPKQLEAALLRVLEVEGADDSDNEEAVFDDRDYSDVGSTLIRHEKVIYQVRADSARREWGVRGSRQVHLSLLSAG